jgi:hypothetical protein
MDEELIRIREAAKQKLHSKIVEAYTKFDVKKALSMIEERIIGEMEDVTDKILGIDRKWHEIEIKEGRIREMLGKEVDRVLAERVQPLICAQVARIIEYKTIQTALKKAIKNRVDSAIYSLEHHSGTEIGKEMDRLVKSHIDAALKDFLAVNAQEE